MTQAYSTRPRALDHLVLPVRFLDVARTRYERLGFTVAPDGLHPFGTENCCIFFDDNTFLEPLAIAHRETCEAAALEGNTFVRNDQAFRFRRGDEGFSHVVAKTDSASDDHSDFVEAAMSGGPIVPFSRSFKTPDGAEGTASFRLAFAADDRAPDAKFFTCEIGASPSVDRVALKRHDNGAVGLADIVVAEPNPSDFQYFLQTFFRQREVDADSFGISLDVGGSAITALTPDGLQAYYGMDGERYERGLRFFGFVVGVADLSKTRALLTANAVEFSERLDKLIVPPAPGQGCMIAFQEVAA